MCVMFSLLPKDIVIIIAYEVHRCTTKRVITEYQSIYRFEDDSVRTYHYEYMTFWFNYRSLYKGGCYYMGIIHNVRHHMNKNIKTKCCIESRKLPNRYYHTSGRCFHRYQHV